MDIYDGLIKAIPSLYDVTKDDEGIRNLKRAYRATRRRYNELAVTVTRTRWPTFF